MTKIVLLYNKAKENENILINSFLQSEIFTPFIYLNNGHLFWCGAIIQLWIQALNYHNNFGRAYDRQTDRQTDREAISRRGCGLIVTMRQMDEHFCSQHSSLIVFCFLCRWPLLYQQKMPPCFHHQSRLLALLIS